MMIDYYLSKLEQQHPKQSNLRKKEGKRNWSWNWNWAELDVFF